MKKNIIAIGIHTTLIIFLFSSSFNISIHQDSFYEISSTEDDFEIQETVEDYEIV